MALPQKNSSQHLEKRTGTSRSAAQEISASSEGGREGRGEEDDVRPMSSFLPQVNVKNSGLQDLTSARVWRNHILWRAGVSFPQSGRKLSLIAIRFPGHRRNSFWSSEFHIWSVCRDAINLAAVSSPCGDTLWQHNHRINPRLRHGPSDRCAHQPNGDDSNCTLRALPSCPVNNICFLSTRGRCAGRKHPPRGFGQKTRIRDSQRRLLDRPRGGGGRLAGSPHRIRIGLHSPVRHVSLSDRPWSS